jgi:MtN3 and saliva related transmembrane protein
MTITPGITYVGYAAGALTVLSLVPQVVRTYRTRKVDGLSWGLVVLLALSGALWLVYGVLASLPPVIITNAGVVILTGALVVAKARFR